MKCFGLIGKTLQHSFSKKYFSEKYKNEGIVDCDYGLFELASINEFTDLIKKHQFVGLNVTIPYKKEIMQYLDELDDHAQKIEAVNTIKFLPSGRLKGFNTDYYGFKSSLSHWNLAGVRALILGAGGASNAVKAALTDMDIPFKTISRTHSNSSMTYEDLFELEYINKYHLIINTTPLGTSPNIHEKPNLPYSELTKDHYLFDLVYNPETTAFMKEGMKKGAKVQNGYKMLIGQAEKAWEIWNS